MSASRSAGCCSGGWSECCSKACSPSLMLTLGGVPMAALLGLVTGVLAFIPNIGAIISGMLMVAVGFSAGTSTRACGRSSSISSSRTSMAIWSCPYIARRDGRPRARAGARHAAADGRAVRDTRRAVRRPDPGDAQGHAGRPQQATRPSAVEREARPRSWSTAPTCCGCSCCGWLLLLLLLLLHHRRAAADDLRTRTSKVRLLSSGKPGGGGPSPQASFGGMREAIFAAFAHLAPSPRQSPETPGRR